MRDIQADPSGMWIVGRKELTGWNSRDHQEEGTGFDNSGHPFVDQKMPGLVKS